MVEVFFCLVVAVIDGNTFVCTANDKKQIEAKLIGIDAPELEQPFGTDARRTLSEWTLMKDARLECPETEQNNRYICKVWVEPESCPGCGKTLDVGLAMLTVGMAWWSIDHVIHLSLQDAGAYRFAEAEALARKVGLWRDPRSVAPSEWRRQQENKQNGQQPD